MKLNRRIGMVIFLLHAFSIAYCQNQNTTLKKCPIITLNYATGLLNNSTTNIITDALGFTWISSTIGLQRFNGNELETIMPVIGSDTFTLSQSVYLFNLSNGLMWISYKNLVLEYDPFLNTFRKIIELQANVSNGFSIIPLKETPEGIWCMQKKKGIIIYNTRGQPVKLFSFCNADEIDNILSSEALLYKSIVTTNKDYLFICDQDKILKINTSVKKASFIKLGKNYYLNLICTEGKLFGAGGSELLMINIDNDQLDKTFFLGKIIGEAVSTNTIALGDNGQLLTSNDNHLYEFDTSLNYKSEITDLDRNPVLNNGFISRIYTDKFKRIWLLGNDNIKRIQNVETPFTHFVYFDTKNNFIKSLYYDEDKHVLLAGCFNGGLQLYDTLANPLWSNTLVNPDVKNILSVEKLTPDEYLIITFTNRWYILTLSTKHIRPFNFTDKLEAVVQPRSVRFTNNVQRIDKNTLFIATGNNVFRCFFDKTELKSADPLLPLNNQYQNEVDCFLYASDKTLWMGTSTGILYRLDEHHQASVFQIPGNYIVRTLTEDSIHNIWVGTDKGLYVYSQQGQMKTKVTSENGLLNDCIYSLLPVHDSAVFASNNLGLSFISLPDNVKNYSKELGLQDLEFNTASCLKTRSGKLYFGGADGITSFYPESLSAIKDTPGLYITRLVINDISQDFSSSVHKRDSILLDYSQNHLQLDITAMGLLNPDEYIYKYRLKGFQDKFEVTHKPVNINYILSPGKYILEIICSPNLSTNIFFTKYITIIIAHPWWQTWWFRILAILFCIMLIALVVHSYNRNKFKQEIKFLQTKNDMQQERERISRDLHDNLGAQANALLYGTEQLQNSDSSESLLVNNLQTTARDMMHSLRETIWVMKHNDAQASEIWFRIINFSKQLNFFYKAIKITTDGDLPDNFIFSSEKALHIVLIVQEALNNAVRHSNAKNILTESIVQNNTWIINVKDDGKGIRKEKENKSLGGFGLNNMKQRALIAGINLIIESTDGKGASVILNIPLEKKISNPK